ncbi:type III-A CRISPR-associated protein Csm2 [Cyanobacterium aponinum AL20118]|nr:type III-A CRISPR-associated protein Csm2 [Cyanobacterium aponinum]WPF90096.1 type III-A CRISPR-associated protein Csm2 [Cyanobacterium aponinum AL20115]
MDKPRLNQSPNRGNITQKTQNSNKNNNSQNKSEGQKQTNMTSTQTILNSLKNTETFKEYPIRDLVKHSEEFGRYLKNQRLETNQIRKFLDAINRLKVKLTQAGENEDKAQLFRLVEPEIVLLKPKLAYAAARVDAAKPLSEVMAQVIDKVQSLDDFERLVQFIESIIAYHKAAGGK